MAALVADPGLDQVAGEDAAFDQPVVVEHSRLVRLIASTTVPPSARSRGLRYGDRSDLPALAVPLLGNGPGVAGAGGLVDSEDDAVTGASAVQPGEGRDVAVDSGYLRRRPGGAAPCPGHGGGAGGRK